MNTTTNIKAIKKLFVDSGNWYQTDIHNWSSMYDTYSAFITRNHKYIIFLEFYCAHRYSHIIAKHRLTSLKSIERSIKRIK